MRGTVTEFSESRGIGTIAADGRTFRFHCTRIADGTRAVGVDEEVEFAVVPGRQGDWEASAIEKVAPR